MRFLKETGLKGYLSTLRVHVGIVVYSLCIDKGSFVQRRSPPPVALWFDKLATRVWDWLDPDRDLF